MKRAFFVVLAVVAALMSLGAAQAQIRTVILSDHKETMFKVSADDAPTLTAELKFPVELVQFPADARVEQCLLRVVPTPQGKLPRADQDVTVLVGDKQVGQWSAYSETLEPYTAALKPEAWTAELGSVLMLKTESKHTAWDYHGGRAVTIAYQPRLIVTYNLPSSPAPVGSGQASFSSTSWTLPDGATLLANPVSYKGASYSIARQDNDTFIYQGSAGPVKRWKLPFVITGKSFTFVTAWGRLQIITEDAIGSCDLENLGEPNSDAPVVSNDPNTIQIQVSENETPAMGPDGSLYFKNVKADGRIVAYNPSLDEIWRTELTFTTVSPISMSANGHYAYALAEIPVADPNKDKEFDLVRIDTATGETVTKEVEYEDMRGKHVSPLLTELLQPVVASNENVDYVFVAGNTNDTGIFQLVAFEPSAETYERRDGKPPKVLWNRLGKVAKHELSGADRFSLFVFGDDSLNLYPFDSSNDSAMDWRVSVGSAGALLADGAAPLYMLDTNKNMSELEQELDEVTKSLDEQKQKLEQEREVTKSLGEQKQKLEQERNEAKKSLDEQEQKLKEANEQILRARTRGVVWGLGIAAVTIGICLLLRFWILRRRKEKTGRAQGGNIV